MLRGFASARRGAQSANASPRSRRFDACFMKTLILHPAFKKFLFCLLDHDVRFLVAGAYVLAVLGRPRVTDDIDVLVEPTKENAQRLADAFAAFGYGALAKKAAAHFSVAERMATLGTPPVAIDVLSSLTGVDFDVAWKNRARIRIGGRTVPMLGREQFIQTKRACGRPKDIADLALLAELDPPKHKRPTPPRKR